MEPAQPPLPDWRYLPFQPETGSQTSRPISESLVGRATTLTAQWAGTPDTCQVVPAEPGTVTGPAATRRAETTSA